MLRECVTKFALCAALLGMCTTTWAAVYYNVNSTLDEVDSDVTDGFCLTASGTCTLRAATMQANHIGLPVVINLPAGTYKITIPRPQNVNGMPDRGFPEEAGALTVLGTAGTTIVGAGAESTIIDGNGIDIVMYESVGPLDLRGVTLRGGTEQIPIDITSRHYAGGLLAEGTVSLSDCIVRDNKDPYGYGALALFASATVTRTVISSNQGIGIGDIYGPISIIDSTINGNSTNGIEVYGPISIIDSTIDGNSNLGIDIQADTTIIGSTIANNASHGIFSIAANLTVLNSTIAGNSADSGAGIYYDDPTGTHAANVYNTTIAYNDANDAGGGIFVKSGSFNIYNTLIAHNTNSALNPDDCSGSIFSHANNLFGTTNNCVITKVNASQYGLLNSVDLLGPLANNGGPTQTIALLDGSNAIDGGPGVGCFDRNSQLITEDQRGFPRPFGARCDIGAFEAGDTIS